MCTATNCVSVVHKRLAAPQHLRLLAETRQMRVHTFAARSRLFDEQVILRSSDSGGVQDTANMQQDQNNTAAEIIRVIRMAKRTSEVITY